MGAIPKTLGKYQILGPIGRGGMGEVYKAYQPDLRRHVAIKTLLAGEHASQDFLERFQREARVAAKLVHPNIVQIHDIGVEARLHYIVMEHVEGRSLRDLLGEKKKLDVETALKIAHFVARALRFAHEHKIIHRDIKPGNILIDKQGRVRILDFGLAKSLADGKALTGAASMIGTPYYMSPEQAFAAPEEVDARTDLYSLGAVLYEMLTGRPPFTGATVLAILRKIEEEDPAPPGVSPAIDALVRRALSKDPAKRPQTASEMAEEIKACLKALGSETAGAPALRGGEGPATPTGRSTRIAGAEPAGGRFRRRAVGAGAAAGAALLLALVAWAAWPSGTPPPPPPPAPPSPSPAPATADPESELRALLARKTEIPSAELARFKNDAQHCRIIAEHFKAQGQYTRMLEYVRGYERAIYELASARGLQRFVSPVLFRLSIPQPRDLQSRAESFLMAALGRHLEGKTDAARQKLRSAVDNGALASHALLLRAHIDLCEVFNDPGGEEEARVLEALRRDLGKAEEPFLLALRALAEQMGGDAAAARRTADALSRRAPAAAETFVLNAILFQRAGRIDLALDQLKDANRMDPKNFEDSVHRAYLRWLEVLGDPGNETLYAEEGKFDVEKMYADEMREAFDDRLRYDHYPAALFLRGIISALESKWDEAENDFALLRRRLGAALDRIVVDHERLKPFVYAGAARSWLYDAACELQLHLGDGESARKTAELITGEDLPEETRYGFLIANRRRLARFSVADEARALHHLGEALKLGALPQEVRDDPALAVLREKPAFVELLKAHRGNHVWAAKQVLADEAAALAHLEEALKVGATPQELRDDAELGEFRARPKFQELLKRYEN
jgi:predicted Ser/Thr protein kinase